MLKLLKTYFIQEVQYSSWLANVILVKKMSGKLCIYEDYINLNKACSKDHFPSQNIDKLVDNFFKNWCHIQTYRVTKMLEGLIGGKVEVYVNNIIDKILGEKDHILNLEDIFTHPRH
ncbi:hypothetical protein CR513_39558, partial [Mucuna pruriens]